jgi:osmotically-inducible protein OsmY
MEKSIRNLSMKLWVVGILAIAACSASTGWRDIVRAIDRKLEQNRYELGRYEITSEVRRGDVQLEGWVESGQARSLAGDLVRQVKGVREVTNNLEVRPQRSKANTAPSPAVLGSLLERLESAGRPLGDYRVTLQQRGDTVIVGGTADSDVTASRLLAKMQQYAPQFQFQNELQIILHNDATIASEIGAAIRREGFAPPDVRVRKGVVVLQGDADSHVTIDKFMTLAQMVPGVRDVRNEMTINGRPYADSIPPVK